MSQKVSIRIMVVDDHHVVRQGLVAMIEREPDLTVVAESGSGEEAVALFRKHKPDVTLMDLRLPAMSGAEAIAAIRSEYPHSRFIVLTTYDGDEDIYRALQAGAQAYLLKGMFREVLIEAIQAVHAGLRRIPPEVQARLDGRMGSHDLTSREVQVLGLIAKGKSNREIAAVLSIGDGTVKWFVKNVLSKLGVNDRTLAVTTALQRGIIRLE
jgi:two-component system NarL family response regulator